MTTVPVVTTPFRVRRLTFASGGRTRTVLGKIHRVMEPAEGSLEFLRAQRGRRRNGE